MVSWLIAMKTKYARPAENFTDLETTMSVVSYPCSFNSRTDVLLEILKEMYCLFYSRFKLPRHGVVNSPFILFRVNVMKSHIHGKKLE